MASSDNLELKTGISFLLKDRSESAAGDEVDGGGDEGLHVLVAVEEGDARADEVVSEAGTGAEWG